jgi:hypothetical protein
LKTTLVYKLMPVEQILILLVQQNMDNSLLAHQVFVSTEIFFRLETSSADKVELNIKRVAIGALSEKGMNEQLSSDLEDTVRISFKSIKNRQPTCQ